MINSYIFVSNANYHKKRRRGRRKKFLMLLGGRCEQCGTRDNLEFDHKRPSRKEFGVSRNINAPDDLVKKEVNKCRLLCKTCHKEKTHKSWDYALPPARHGSLWMYKKFHCRCNKCKKVMSDYYHAKKK